MGKKSKSAKVMMHRAARIEDAIHEFRERRARRRGLVVTVIPYTGYGSTEWVRVLGRVLLTRKPKPGTRRARKAERRYESVRGWRSFTSVPVGDGVVTVTVEGVDYEVNADRGGVVDITLPIQLAPGWHTVAMRTEHEEPVEAPIYIVDPASEFGIICDVDDTVMVTALPRPLLAAWNTFVLDEHARRPTPGMAVMLDRLIRDHPGSPVIYLSTGAWNVAPTLTRFLSRNLYPAGPLLLTDWGPTHDRFFRSGMQHKRESLDRLARDFPKLRWLLVGDDGQHDEEIYGDFALRNPENVACIAIRQLSPSEAVLAGGRSKTDAPAAAVPTAWVYSPDGAGIYAQLDQAGLA